jgi:hypothetical protein
MHCPERGGDARGARSPAPWPVGLIPCSFPVCSVEEGGDCGPLVAELCYRASGFPSTIASYDAARDASIKLLEFLKARRDGERLRDWLIGPGGPLDMDQDATVGGTLERYRYHSPAYDVSDFWLF